MEDLGAQFEFDGTKYQVQTIDDEQMYAVEVGNISNGRTFTADEVEELDL